MGVDAVTDVHFTGHNMLKERFAVYDRMRVPDTEPVCAFDDVVAAVKAAVVLIENGHQIICICDRQHNNKLVLGWDKP